MISFQTRCSWTSSCYGQLYYSVFIQSFLNEVDFDEGDFDGISLILTDFEIIVEFVNVGGGWEGGLIFCMDGSYKYNYGYSLK